MLSIMSVSRLIFDEAVTEFAAFILARLEYANATADRLAAGKDGMPPHKLTAYEKFGIDRNAEGNRHAAVRAHRAHIPAFVRLVFKIGKATSHDFRQRSCSLQEYA